LNKAEKENRDELKFHLEKVSIVSDKMARNVTAKQELLERINKYQNENTK